MGITSVLYRLTFGRRQVLFLHFFVLLLVFVAGCSVSDTKSIQLDSGTGESGDADELTDGSENEDSSNTRESGDVSELTDGAENEDSDSGTISQMDGGLKDTQVDDDKDAKGAIDAHEEYRDTNNSNDDSGSTEETQDETLDERDLEGSDAEEKDASGMADASHASDAGGETWPIEQRVVFEETYDNYAWVSQMDGRFIDNQGNVYSYDHSHEYWSPIDPENITESELQEKHSNAQLLNTINKETLLNYYNLIDDVETDSFVDIGLSCFDCGRRTYVAYLYNSAIATYTPVLLYEFGADSKINASEQGFILYLWLLGVFSLN